MTHPAPPPVSQPEYRPFTVHVLSVQAISPSFSRVTFGGHDLGELASNGYDQRVKIAFPVPSHGVREYPRGADWFAAWRAMPDGRRNPLRSYTIRRERAREREIDVDFVVHSAEGPAGAWLETARRGDAVVVIGPNGRHEGTTRGYEWHPPQTSSRLVLGADETAVPAVCAILEQLPDDARGVALLEVPGTDDVLEVTAPAGMDVAWLPRSLPAGRSTPRGALLSAAVEHAAAVSAPAAVPADGIGSGEVDGVLWDVPGEDGRHERGWSPETYVWLAGEAGVVGDLRRRLREDAGLDRRSLAAMGYWREGRAAVS